MKKTLSILMSLFLLLGGVAAAELNAVANTFPISDETITLNVMAVRVRSEIIDWDTNWLTQYWEEKLNLDIVWDLVPSATADEKMAVIMAGGGQMPDIIVGYGFTKDQAVAYGAQGLLMPMNDLIDQYGANLQYAYEQNDQIENSITAPDGNIYFLPKITLMDNHHMSFSQKLLMNHEWLERVGMKKPSTPDELYEVLKAFKEQDANGNGDLNDEIPLTSNGGSDLGRFIMQAFQHLGYTNTAATYFYVEDGEVKTSYTQNGWREGLAYMNKLYTEGLIDKEVFMTDGNAIKMLTGAETGNRIGAVEAHSYSAVMDLSNDVVQEFSFVEPLKNADGVRVIAGNNLLLEPYFFIPSSCSNPEAAFRFADAMLADAFANGEVNEDVLSSLYGPQDEGWRKAQDGEFGLDGTTPAAYAWLFTWGQPNNLNMHEFLLSFFGKNHKLLMVAPNDGSFNQEYELYQATANLYKPYGVYKNLSNLIMFAEDEVAEANQLKTDIETYMKEAKCKFIMGELDLEKDWDGYLNELENLGYSRLLEMHQTAYTRQFGQ